MKKVRIIFGILLCKIGEKIKPNYWKCIGCGHIEFKEEEVYCWKCSTGEMIYKL
jgi:hypothetical protein